MDSRIYSPPSLPSGWKILRRFTVFVEIYRDKIRKKIRLTREPEPALD